MKANEIIIPEQIKYWVGLLMDTRKEVYHRQQYRKHLEAIQKYIDVSVQKYDDEFHKKTGRVEKK